MDFMVWCMIFNEDADQSKPWIDLMKNGFD